MNSEASFDVLYLLDSLRSAYQTIHIAEIHSLCYLAQLLATYDGRPIASWGYSFAHHEYGGPHSFELDNALTVLTLAGYVADVATRRERFELRGPGAMLVAQLANLSRFSWRKQYMTACADAALNRPLPVTITALQHEPLLESASQAQRTETLGEGPYVDILYEHFDALRTVLGTKAKDLWAAAVLWLDYLRTVETGKADRLDDG